MDTDEAIKELQNLRQIHAQRSEERQRFSLTVLLAGTGVLFGMLAAAEQRNPQGVPQNLHLYWLMPFFILALWSFDIRFRQLSARHEELMQRIYNTQVRWLIGPTAQLHPKLVNFRDAHVQYYSKRNALRRSTRLFQTLTNLPLLVLFFWSIVSVAYLERVPRFWILHPAIVRHVGANADQVAWAAGTLVLATVIYWVRRWRYYRFEYACCQLEDLPPPEPDEKNAPAADRGGSD